MLKIAVIGATGLVGSEMLKVLAESTVLSNAEVFPVASEKSVGKKVLFKDKELSVISVDTALSLPLDVAIFSAGGSTSLALAPKFAEKGVRVIDNSSAWRMVEHIPLIVPEVNPEALHENDFIVANPNCSTIQMVLILKVLHSLYGLKRVVISTYQSVTGTGVKAVEQLMQERKGILNGPKAYPHPIDLNVLPHIDVFLENGYTKEEMKMILETQKIMSLPSLGITATTVRVPALGGHSESLNIELLSDFDIELVRNALAAAPGVVVQDAPSENLYPMPIYAQGKNEVFVGRIRRDFSQANTLNCWVVADNLRKGAATNAVQIAELMVSKAFLNA